MANDNNNVWGLTGRVLPSRQTDQTYGPLRSTARGELVTAPIGKPMIGLADEGSYFVATNPTIGTGIAGIAAADGFDALETLFYLRNTDSDSGAKRLYLDFMELACTVVDTNGTNVRYDMHIDNTSRFSSGGTAITPVNVNMDSAAATIATLRFGAVVTTAASADVRYLGGRLVSSTDLVADDTFRFEFGSPGGGSNVISNLSAEATLPRGYIVAAPPVVLGPGDCFLFSINCASQSGAATWSFNAGWYER